MSYFIYNRTDGHDTEQESKALSQYANDNHFENPQWIEDTTSIKTHWTERKIGKLLKSAKIDDTIIVYDAAHLACSTSQMLELLNMASTHNIHLHFVKYNHVLENKDATANTQHLLQLISKIESDFISKRTSQALARRRAAGLPLGRPKGRGNKSLKLDKHKEDITKYLELGISKASIAKLVDCHPQTLYDWLDRNKFDTSKAV